LGETELRLVNEDHETDFVWGANMALRRHALDLVGNFDETLGMGGTETKWEERLRDAGGTVVYVADAMLWHRRTPSDLRLRRLLRRRFHRARNSVINRLRYTEDLSILCALRMVPLHLGHAIRCRCSGGLLSVAQNLGTAWGLLARRYEK
jgi:GT2 family glycosyltransferase